MTLKTASSHPVKAYKYFGVYSLGFTTVMNQKMESMWAKKLGLVTYDAPLVNENSSIDKYSTYIAMVEPL